MKEQGADFQCGLLRGYRIGRIGAARTSEYAGHTESNTDHEDARNNRRDSLFAGIFGSFLMALDGIVSMGIRAGGPPHHAAQHKGGQQHFDMYRHFVVNHTGANGNQFADHRDRDGVSQNPRPTRRDRPLMQIAPGQPKHGDHEEYDGAKLPCDTDDHHL